MLVIRLSRVGRKKAAAYRLVAADKRRAATGKVVARLGHYNPYTKETVINKEAVEGYLAKGAQPSSSAVKLLKKQGVKLPKWAEANLEVKNKAPKKKDEKEAEAKPAAKAESEVAEKSDEKAAKGAEKQAEAPKEEDKEAPKKVEQAKEEQNPPAGEEEKPAEDKAKE